MTTRVGEWLGMAVVFAALLMARSVLTEVDNSRGSVVYLGHLCSQLEMSRQGDGRPIVVRYAPGGESRINNFVMPLEGDIRRTIKTVMSTRQERALYFMGDERFSYGEVADLVSSLQSDSDGLTFLLYTRSQIEELDRQERKRGFPLCMPYGVAY